MVPGGEPGQLENVRGLDRDGFRLNGLTFTPAELMFDPLHTISFEMKSPFPWRPGYPAFPLGDLGGSSVLSNQG